MGFRFLKRKWIKHIAIPGKNPIFGKSGLPGKIFPGINCYNHFINKKAIFQGFQFTQPC